MTTLFPTATVRTVAPYRNDVVGSFLRTDALKNAKAKLNAGEIDQSAYDVVLKEEIGKLVAKKNSTACTLCPMASLAVCGGIWIF